MCRIFKQYTVGISNNFVKVLNYSFLIFNHLNEWHIYGYYQKHIVKTIAL